MISHTHKFVFVHIPKCAGTSMERALSNVCVPLLHGDANSDSLYFKHTDINGFKQMLGGHFGAYFSFTSVRNPWDWIVSLYEFNRGMQRVYLKGTNYKAVGAQIPKDQKDMSFDDWLIWWTETFGATQSKLICDEDGRLLVQRILAQEDIVNGFQSVVEHLQLPNRELPWVHKREKKGPREAYFNPELRDFVEHHFQEDIARFGYSFEDPSGYVPDKLRRLDADWKSRTQDTFLNK